MANCPNCGAPLPLSGLARCEYCGSSVLPDASVSADAVRIQLLAIEVARMRFADAQAKLLQDISNRPRRNTFE